jgi:hypothetical protein
MGRDLAYRRHFGVCLFRKGLSVRRHCGNPINSTTTSCFFLCGVRGEGSNLGR